MNNKIQQEGIIVISLYKFLINFLRIFLALFIFNFKCSINSMINYIAGINFLNPAGFIIHSIDIHIKHAPLALTCVLGAFIIIFSVIELIFVFGLVLKRRWGAVGLFVMGILWVPVELLVISKFILMSKFLIFIIDFIILIFLFRLIRNPSHYFTK